MAENTKIEWAHHTFNPWIGCTKVGPGCDHCYAERDMDHRWGRVKWGPGNPRQRTSHANWKKPLQWNRQAEKAGTRFRVFCASLADVFDNEVPTSWRTELFDLIRKTPNLDWLLLTKRIGNVRALIGASLDDIEMQEGWQSGTDTDLAALRDWLADWYVLDRPPANVWLGITVVNQEEADRDIPKLLATPAAVRWLSMEPLLGEVVLPLVRRRCPKCSFDGHGMPGSRCPRCGLHSEDKFWVVTGGESGPNARPSHPDWFRSLRDQCAAAGVPFLFKQWGEWAPDCDHGKPLSQPACQTIDRPKPGRGAMFRCGKKAAGRTLDGKIHDDFPEGAA